MDDLMGFDDALGLMEWTSGFSTNLREIAVAMRRAVYSLSDDISGMISKILPVALPVLGIAIAVFFGVKFIKKTMK